MNGKGLMQKSKVSQKFPLQELYDETDNTEEKSLLFNLSLLFHNTYCFKAENVLFQYYS